MSPHRVRGFAVNWRCLFGLHAHPLLYTFLRDAAGAYVEPTTVVWVCARCAKEIARTVLARGPVVRINLISDRVDRWRS